MEKSESIPKLATDLCNAQSMLKPAPFDARNPHFNSRYATLTSVMEAVRPALAAHNLSVVQATAIENEPQLRVSVETWLIHASGEWLKSTISLKPLQDTPQAVGSCLSYCRRYGISALLGVTSGEDDDANAASEPTGKTVAMKPKIMKIVKEPESKTPSKNMDADKNTDTAVKSQPPAPAPKPANNRVALIREIFGASAKLQENPQEMRETISKILGLDHIIRDSAELKDTDLAKIAESYRGRMAQAQDEQRRAA